MDRHGLRPRDDEKGIFVVSTSLKCCSGSAGALTVSNTVAFTWAWGCYALIMNGSGLTEFVNKQEDARDL